MEKVLNRGLKHFILPLKLEVTQVLKDFRRFERTMTVKEYLYGKEKDVTYVKPLLKQKKHNFPRNNKAPRGLLNYLAAVKSEMMGPKKKQVVKSNITEGEKEALVTKRKKNSDKIMRQRSWNYYSIF